MQSAIMEMDDEEFIKHVASRIIPIQSISPESGGSGESARADEICTILRELGYPDFKRYDTKDSHGAVRAT